MTNEQINIAVAEYCGWPGDDVCQCGDSEASHKTYTHSFTPYPYPDYANDLNAMHEAEMAIGFGHEGQHGEELRIIARCVGPRGGHFTPNAFGIRAIALLTARQRAEAFLRAVGKWEESE